MYGALKDLKLNDACKEQHQLVLKKGFEPQPIAVKLMLIVSELGEACEADRTSKHANVKAFEAQAPIRLIDMMSGGCLIVDSTTKEHINEEMAISMCKSAFENTIKDTFEDEIADTFLRLMELCGEYDIDIEKHIKLKAAYNETRPLKHGKEY